MIIQVNKFGTVLVSRPAGKEAWLAFQPVLFGISKKVRITVDFKDVLVLTPSWADEFLTPLKKRYGKQIKLKNIKNPSIKATLEILKK